MRVFVHLHRIFVRACPACVCVANACARPGAVRALSLRGGDFRYQKARPAPRVGGHARVVAVRCHRPGSRASAAGVTWTCRTAKAGWAGRGEHTSVVDAAGAIYVIGGSGDGTTTFYADVWASTDGGAVPDSVKGGRGVLGGT